VDLRCYEWRGLYKPTIKASKVTVALHHKRSEFIGDLRIR